MKNYKQIINELKNKKYKPIYFLMGKEPYYIDLISKFIEKNVLSEEEKCFNQNVFYAKEIEDIPSLITEAKRYPIMSRYIVIIIKEAQFLSNSIEKNLIVYLKKPIKSTLLVICYKNKVLDKKKELYKVILKKGVLFESKKYFEYQIPSWIENKVKSMKRSITLKAQNLLIEHLGTSLSIISNELEKINLALPKKNKITSDIISQFIGIDKHFNIFEWQKAIAEKKIYRTQEIIWHFGKNSKEYPIVFLINIIYKFFLNLIKYHINKSNNQLDLCKILNVPIFFIKYYEKGSYNYSLNKILTFFSYLREADKQTKKINYSFISNYNILQELIYKIFS